MSVRSARPNQIRSDARTLSAKAGDSSNFHRLPITRFTSFFDFRLGEVAGKSNLSAVEKILRSGYTSGETYKLATPLG
jgi:hypothetical protein